MALPNLGRAVQAFGTMQGLQAQSQDRRAAIQAAEAQAMRDQQLADLKIRYAKSQDPEALRQIIIQSPDAAAKIQQQFGVIDDQTKADKLNKAATLKQMIETNPQEAAVFFRQSLADDPAFDRLTDNFQSGDMTGALDDISFTVTALGGQEAYDSLFNVDKNTDPAQPSSVREWEYYNTLDDSQKQQYINMKRANQLYTSGDVTMQVDPVAGGGTVVTEQGTAPTTQAESQKDLTTQQAEKAATIKAAEQAIAQSQESFTNLERVRAAIPNLDEAMTLVDEGANTGVIMSKLPSVQEASLKLDNLQGRLGLDVIGNTTFGALSKDELLFALDVALPKNLKGPALKDWLQKKKDSQIKLANYLEEAAIFLGTPGNTIADFLNEKKTSTDLSNMSDDDLMNF